jgi:hypothetical protein
MTQTGQQRSKPWAGTSDRLGSEPDTCRAADAPDGFHTQILTITSATVSTHPTSPWCAGRLFGRRLKLGLGRHLGTATVSRAAADPGRREDREPRSDPNGRRADLDGPKSADCPLHAVARRSGRARSRTRCLTRAPSNGRGSRGGAPPNCAPPTTPATRHARAPGVSEAFRRRGSSPGHMSRCASCGKLKALDLGPGGLPQPWPRPAA